MALRLEQDFQYAGDDYWKWSVWVEGPDAELNQISQVTYTLHPTFPHPVRTISDRSSKFRLDTAGWGTFTIYATAEHKDGRKSALEHELELRYPDGRATTA
jgi:transcription initiation factor IIF auxiliary subunit